MSALGEFLNARQAFSFREDMRSRRREPSWNVYFYNAKHERIWNGGVNARNEHDAEFKALKECRECGNMTPIFFTRVEKA
jgi:hypothetical protein